MQTKVCNTCAQEKPINEFSKDKHIKDGYASRCKECTKIFFRQYRAENRDALNAYYRAYFKGNQKHYEHTKLPHEFMPERFKPNQLPL